jgi:hypothetical protein
MEDENTHQVKPGSLFARTAALRDERANARDLSAELPVPTWEMEGVKTLIWSFRLVPKKQLDKYADSRGGGSKSLEGDIDLLVSAHNGFFFYDPSKQQPGTRLWPDKAGNERTNYVRAEYNNGDPIPADQDFAEIIGFEPSLSSDVAPSTQLVLHLTRNNDSAIANLAARVAAWCQNTDLDITQLMLGES